MPARPVDRRVGALPATLPVIRPPSHVRDGENDDRFWIVPVDHCIRKPIDQRFANGRANESASIRVLTNERDGSLDLGRERTP